MSDKNRLNARVVNKIMLHDDLMLLRVAYDEMSIPDFKPGQFGTLGLPSEDGRLVRRAYSISSPNTEKSYLEFFITKVKDGALTPRLFALNEGDPLWMAPKITGFFFLDDSHKDKNLVFVGTGTGLGPFVSMLKSGPLGANGRKVTLVHGARVVDDLGYKEDLEKLASERENFFYHPTLSRMPEGDCWAGHRGRVSVCLKKSLFENDWKELPSPETTNFFLCGNPDMVKSITETLESEGFKKHSRKEPGQVHTEKYW